MNSDSKQILIKKPKIEGMSEKEFKELGETFDTMEDKLLGEHRFENMIKKVSKIEQKLGIYKLEQFTPHV